MSKEKHLPFALTNDEKVSEKVKQIEEIKECIDEVYGQDCAYYDVDGFAIANEIYNAGYRKQSEGEWIYPTNEFNLPKCSICGMTSHDATYAHRQYYCSHCGSKMKGGE